MSGRDSNLSSHTPAVAREPEKMPEGPFSASRSALRELDKCANNACATKLYCDLTISRASGQRGAGSHRVAQI